MSGDTALASCYAGHISEFDDGGRRLVDVRGREVVVLRHGDRYYALDNTCLHLGGPVGEGMVVGKVEAVLDADQRLVGHRFSDREIHIVCPWHGYEYDLDSGELAGDARRRLRTYATEVRGEGVFVLNLPARASS